MSDCVSGSPKRQLNSSTLGPPWVKIIPAKSTPRNSISSRRRASSVGTKTSRSIMRSTSLVARGVGEYAPMPPVLGPMSPSPSCLWSWHASSIQIVFPSTSASTLISWPCRRSSITMVVPASPYTFASSAAVAAAMACALLSHTVTPLPAHKPVALTTSGSSRLLM